MSLIREPREPFYKDKPVIASESPIERLQESFETPADQRIKSAMVLFALEESLGSYVTENSPDVDDLPDGVRANIQTRAQGTGPISTVKHIVQSTYISELLD